jgi:hypothetical protein
MSRRASRWPDLFRVCDAIEIDRAEMFLVHSLFASVRDQHPAHRASSASHW